MHGIVWHHKEVLTWLLTVQCHSECGLESGLTWSLDSKGNIPATKHGEGCILREGCDIGWIASFNNGRCRAHIHKLHIGTKLYLGVSHGIAAGIVHRDNHRIGVIDPPWQHLEGDGKISHPLRLT